MGWAKWLAAAAAPLLAFLATRDQWTWDLLTAAADAAESSFNVSEVLTFDSMPGLYMMGSNKYGALGLGTRLPYVMPRPARVRALDGAPIDAVALGGRHSAVLSSGTLYVFGDNAWGQLGLPGRYYRATPTPLPSPNGRKVEAVTLGAFSTAFIAAGELFACGYVRYEWWRAYLGLGAQRTPRLVPAPNGRPVTQAALGDAHFAFIAGGELFAWGYNSNGELGFRDILTVSAPTPIHAPNGQPATFLAVGAEYSIFKAGGQYFGTGRNYYGQVGEGWYKLFSPIEVTLPDGQPIDAIVTAEQHVAVLSGTRLFVRGFNGDCRLGIGSAGVPYRTFEIRAPNGHPIEAVTAGHTRTAFQAGGEWFVFGGNEHGQLGFDTEVGVSQLSEPAMARLCVPTPLAVPPGVAVRAVVFGGEHTAVVTEPSPAAGDAPVVAAAVPAD